MVRSVGKLVDSSFDNPRTRKRHKRYHIRLNAEFIECEEFPFKPNDELLISIQDEKLVMEKV